MFEWEVAGIALVLLAVVLGGAYNFIVGPKGPLVTRWNKEIRELEVRIRMDSDEQLINDLQQVARLYVRVGKRWEAEQALKRALIISKQQWGEGSPLVMNLLQECAQLMDSMRRKGEATNFRKEIKKIRRR